MKYIQQLCSFIISALLEIFNSALNTKFVVNVFPWILKPLFAFTLNLIRCSYGLQYFVQTKIKTNQYANGIDDNWSQFRVRITLYI